MTKEQKACFLIAPLVVFLGLTFFYGLGFSVVDSLSGVGLGPHRLWTLAHYRVVLADSNFIESLFLTLSVAGVATLLSHAAGTALAFAMLGAPREGKWLRRLLLLPVIMPHLVVAVIVFHIFAQTGVLARLAWWAGFIGAPQQFPLLVFDPYAVGIMLVYLYKQIPFVAMVAYDTLGGISDRFAHVAANLGASSWQIATSIYLPLLRPTLVSTSLITFAFAFGAFEVPLLLGTPAWRTLPVESYILYTNIDPNTQVRAMVINVLITLMALSLSALYSDMERLMTTYRNGGGM